MATQSTVPPKTNGRLPRVDGQLNREIAERFGISLRLVESELSAAMKYCLQRMPEAGDPYTDSRSSGPRKF